MEVNLVSIEQNQTVSIKCKLEKNTFKGKNHKAKLNNFILHIYYTVLFNLVIKFCSNNFFFKCAVACVQRFLGQSKTSQTFFKAVKHYVTLCNILTHIKKKSILEYSVKFSATSIPDSQIFHSLEFH